jgi:hypothetical protein
MQFYIIRIVPAPDPALAHCDRVLRDADIAKSNQCMIIAINPRCRSKIFTTLQINPLTRFTFSSRTPQPRTVMRSARESCRSPVRYRHPLSAQLAVHRSPPRSRGMGRRAIRQCDRPRRRHCDDQRPGQPCEERCWTHSIRSPVVTGKNRSFLYRLFPYVAGSLYRISIFRNR